MKKNATKQQRNPYATNRGGRITSPTATQKDEPRATVTRGDNLRK